MRVGGPDGEGAGDGAASFDGVIFDLDGTLIDTLEDIADAMDRVLALGYPAPLILEATLGTQS